ncbi:hypothetical protein OG302_43070 [Streptomyces sp. NBC_01283]|uniref:hypothetical protein n=1 Tax=Streptomyces sp. NBC_01283 TaxID=2903812 RepID=UPI00352FDB3E|nr:hypothetical protein OG302_43070 [Streptomyces sp. NBC_01283]
MTQLHPPALASENVYRIHWKLGTDRLLAVCHCGAQREFEDPVGLWDWLLGHPEDHCPGPASQSSSSCAPSLHRGSSPEAAPGPERRSP